MSTTVRIVPYPDPATAPKNADVAALTNNIVAKVGPGVLYGVSGYSTTAQFLQLHDSATLPADTAVPLMVIPIAANTAYSIDFGAYGRGFNRGIVVCNSTTGPTKTIGGSDTWISARYA